MKAIKAGWLISAYHEIHEKSGLLLEDGRVREVLPNQQIDRMVEEGVLPAEEVLDRSESIVFPGFVNAHMHQYGVLSHGIPQAGDVRDFDTFLTNYWWPLIENRLRKEQVLITAEYTAAEMIRSGITAFCDILEAPFTEDDTLIEQGKLLEKAGLRAVVSLESSERVSEENGRHCLRLNAEAADYFAAKGGRVRGAICTHTTFSCSDGFIREAASLARERDAIFQFHLSESRYEPDRLRRERDLAPAALYDQMDALGESTIASQCVKVTEEELELLRRTGTRVVHMPVSNCEVGGGIAPVPAMLKAGMEVALGTDGYINDFFTVMKEAFLIHKANEETTEVMSAPEVFRMATEFGAKAMGLADCGRLQPGCQADFAVCADAFPTPLTAGNLMDQLVVHGKSGYVTDVAVGGKMLLSDGGLTLLDESGIHTRMRECARSFWQGVR